MSSKRMSWLSLVLALAMLLSSTAVVSAQGGNDVHLPFVSNGADPLVGPMEPRPTARPMPAPDTSMPQSDVSIVVMEAAPIVAYEG